MDLSNFEAAIQNILEMDSRTLGVDRVSLWLFNEDHSEIKCEALYKGKEDIHEKGNARRTRHSSHYFEALENSRVLAVAHAQGDPRTDELKDDYLRPLGIQSLMDLPVRLNGALIGVVFHEHTDQPREWNVDEQDFAASIADAISLAFAAAERQRADEALRAAYDELEERVEDRTAQLSKLNVLLKQENAQRERAETQLTDTLAEVQRSRDDLMAVLDQLHSGTVMTDEDGRVTFVSEAAQHLLHQGLEKGLGRPWMEWFPFQEQDKVELQAIAALPPEQRRKLSVQVGPPPGGHTLRVDLEIQVNDDPRNQQRKIVFLYDQSEVHNLRRLLEDKIQFHDLVGKSKAMVLVYHQIRQVAKVDTTVLIEGETGTGKELVARAIHFSSHRKDAPFIAVNCAGLTESLLGSQLFGHKRGAFTGAVSDHQGVFEAASGGTLFLDEIGDIPLTVQTSLLRVLQEREVTPLGESKPRKVDARVLVATNRNLVEAVDSGQFRADLLYRIRIARIHLPPLRNRQEDIPLLSGTFLKLARSMTQKDVDSFSPAAMRSLLDYYWPGNVRELRSAIESAVIQCEGTNIEASDLPPEIATDHRPSPGIEGDSDDKGTILSALDRAQGNRSEAARLLGISRATLFRRLSHHGLSRPK
jgi:transcriptional regulator with PAS, ATPase and Fis domain